MTIAGSCFMKANIGFSSKPLSLDQFPFPMVGSPGNLNVPGAALERYGIMMAKDKVPVDFRFQAIYW